MILFFMGRVLAQRSQWTQSFCTLAPRHDTIYVCRMKFLICFFAVIFVAVSFPVPILAQDNIFNRSGQPIPRFVSLKSDKVFVRAGPGVRYPVKWVFKKRGYPIEIKQEFDTWRKVRDHMGEEGWIHQTLLSGKRRVLIQGDKGDDAVIYKKPITESQPVAALEANVIAVLERCAGNWCRVEVGGFKGWIERKSLWGVYEGEQIN